MSTQGGLLYLRWADCRIVAAPSQGTATVFSGAASVPVVKSVARLGDYATVDLFDATEKARVRFEL